MGILGVFLNIIMLTAVSQPAVTDSVAENYSIDRVVVTGTRVASDVRHLPMTVSVVGRSELERRGTSSLLPVLNEQIPGLFVTSRGILGYGVSDGAGGSMSLRGIGGTTTTDVLVIIDGRPEYMGLMGHTIADACQTMMAERVEVLRGPASVLYGSNAMGGVINIVTRKPADGVHTSVDLGYGSFNTAQGNIANSVRKGRFTSFVSADYGRTDGQRRNMDFEQYGGYLKLGYEISHHWNITADGNFTHFNASNPGTVTAPKIDNYYRVTRVTSSLGIENNYDKTSGAVRLYYNWGHHWINDGYAVGRTPLPYRYVSRDVMLGATVYQSTVLWRGSRLTAGVDYQHFGGRAWNDSIRSPHNVILADRAENEAAAYADIRQTLGKFTIDAGIRADYHSRTGLEWVPQAGVTFRPTANSELRVMASKGFRNPTIKDLYMFRPANSELRPERLWNYELSWSQRLLHGRVSYGVNIFYLNGDNMIQRQIVGGSPLNVNTGKVENCGAELSFAYRISASWTVNANYAYLHMHYPVLASPEHKFYAGADFSLKRWSVATGLQYVGGLYTALSPVSKEDFVLWNLRVRYKAARWATVYVRGENLLAQRYEVVAGYPMPRATVFGGVEFNF